MRSKIERNAELEWSQSKTTLDHLRFLWAVETHDKPPESSSSTRRVADPVYVFGSRQTEAVRTGSVVLCETNPIFSKTLALGS
jgi:hypothetical protein